MTTLADMTLQLAKKIMDVMESAAESGSLTTLSDSALTQPNGYFEGGPLWILSGAHAGKVMPVSKYSANQLTFPALSSVLCIQQVETATVFGSVTGSGNATLVVTAAEMSNTPKTVSVALLNLDTALQVATKMRTALSADADVSAFFSIGGTGADIILTAKIARANDLTMNMSIANGTCTGLTAAPTSANTTAGVAGPRYAVGTSMFTYSQLALKINQCWDEEGALVTGEDITLIGDGTTLEFSLPAGAEDLERVEFLDTDARRSLSGHWRTRNGKLRFDYGYAPWDGDKIVLVYKKKHDELVNSTDVIDTEINLDWLLWKSVDNILHWALKTYQYNPNYKFQDFLNEALQRLTTLTPRRKAFVTIHTAGG